VVGEGRSVGSEAGSEAGSEDMVSFFFFLCFLLRVELFAWILVAKFPALL
jgi:hypothetical protein